MPRYKCKSIAALDIVLGGLPAKMQVEADVGTGVSAKTVGELRRVTTWSENLVITTPQERHPESAVKISKARRRAQQCLEMAGTFRDREARATLSHMAQVWVRLADNYEDADGMVGQSKAAEEARPVVQQQQQIQPDD